jgi:hypothetical protein
VTGRRKRRAFEAAVAVVLGAAAVAPGAHAAEQEVWVGASAHWGRGAVMATSDGVGGEAHVGAALARGFALELDGAWYQHRTHSLLRFLMLSGSYRVDTGRVSPFFVLGAGAYQARGPWARNRERVAPDATMAGGAAGGGLAWRPRQWFELALGGRVHYLPRAGHRFPTYYDIGLRFAFRVFPWGDEEIEEDDDDRDDRRR